MGKKVSQTASTKTSKKKEKQIKVLRPKVYITDSSSFKQLVQELTGGYRGQTSNAKAEVEKVPIIEIEDQGEIAATRTLSMDSWFNSFELCDQEFQFKEIDQLTSLVQTADVEISMFDDLCLSRNYQETDWLAYQNLESWLWDAEAEPYYSCLYRLRSA